jgi:hypothetical protein
MGLIQFSTINDSLLALGLLQNETMSNGRRVKLAFTRSKILNSLNGKDEVSSEMFDIPEEGQVYCEENFQKCP